VASLGLRSGVGPFGRRYRELAWYPLNQTYIWGAGGNCKLLNLTSPLLNWTVPAAWTSKLDFAGTGYVQATQCNHWHATGVDYVGDTSWIPGHPFNSTLKMSIDLWYSIAANAPQLIIRMIPLPNGSRAVITTTSVGYKAHIDGSSSEVCSPPPMCDGKPTPSVYGTYCIAKKDAQQGQLGGAVGYACGELASHGFDCATGIPPGCVDDLHLKANYIFSTYEEKKLGSCDFGGVAMLSDPNGQTPPCVNRNGTW
jgi:putative component of membrane protein insertase Oxa1/YidC/SpoIIIJ protein YidD